MTSFSIDFPENIIEPKGLHLPKREDVELAVSITRAALEYIPSAYFDAEEDFEITIEVNDEVTLFDGKICSCTGFGEGATLHPAISQWTVVDIFDAIMHTLLGPPDKGETV